MKEKFKAINFPALLLLIASVFSIKSVLLSIFSLFKGYWTLISPIFFINTLTPLVLFYLIFMKEDKKKLLGLISVILSVASLLCGVINIPYLFKTDAFITIIVNGQLCDVIVNIFTGVLLLILGIKLIKNKDITTGYYFLCGLCIFLVLYGSVFTAIANPLAILSRFPIFLYTLSLWYIPKLYKESERYKTCITSGKIKGLIITAVAMYALLTVATLFAGGSTTSYKNDRGYWGSDGYYHATESEAAEARRRANEWMAENWY
ncbi:MAG: hypothetical protein Q4G23_04200 [Clostridia bacterium]|nr:hypothetical protein [Clostridia bacterium]